MDGNRAPSGGQQKSGAMLRAALAVGLLALLAGCGWAQWPPQRGTMTPLPASPPPPPPPSAAAPEPVGRVDVATLPPPSPQPPSAAAPLPALSPPPSGPTPVRIAPGDTVYSLSRRYGVPPQAIIDANRLQPPFRLQVGQTVLVPARREHVVAPGETVFSIARAYGVDVYALASANGLVAPYRLHAGQRLTVPLPTGGKPGGGSLPQPPPPPSALTPAGAAPFSAASVPPAPAAPDPSALVVPPPLAGAAPLPKPPPASSGGFIWPVKGRIVSSFGAKKSGHFNDGINIAAPAGAPVRAAENGVVTYAGNELRGFGNLVLIRHAGGWTTAYAHNEKLLVRRGQTVHKGQVIAVVGSSGGVSSPQLHFEMRKGKKAVDPLTYLGTKRT